MPPLKFYYRPFDENYALQELRGPRDNLFLVSLVTNDIFNLSKIVFHKNGAISSSPFSIDFPALSADRFPSVPFFRGEKKKRTLCQKVIGEFLKRRKHSKHFPGRISRSVSVKSIRHWQEGMKKYVGSLPSSSLRFPPTDLLCLIVQLGARG